MGTRVRDTGKTVDDTRSELLVQLYYDRADAVLHDVAAARVIDVAIGLLMREASSREAFRDAKPPDGGRTLQ